MYHSWMGLCSGHENYVVIRELSLYPQSLLAKLTVCLFMSWHGELWTIEALTDYSTAERQRTVGGGVRVVA